MKKTLEETFWENYREEIRLRAENNYGNFRNREELKEKILYALDEIADEIKKDLKQSDKTKEVIEEILDDYDDYEF